MSSKTATETRFEECVARVMALVDEKSGKSEAGKLDMIYAVMLLVLLDNDALGHISVSEQSKIEDRLDTLKDSILSSLTGAKVNIGEDEEVYIIDALSKIIETILESETVEKNIQGYAQKNPNLEKLLGAISYVKIFHEDGDEDEDDEEEEDDRMDEDGKTEDVEGDDFVRKDPRTLLEGEIDLLGQIDEIERDVPPSIIERTCPAELIKCMLSRMLIPVTSDQQKRQKPHSIRIQGANVFGLLKRMAELLNDFSDVLDEEKGKSGVNNSIGLTEEGGSTSDARNHVQVKTKLARVRDALSALVDAGSTAELLQMRSSSPDSGRNSESSINNTHLTPSSSSSPQPLPFDQTKAIMEAITPDLVRISKKIEDGISQEQKQRFDRDKQARLLFRHQSAQLRAGLTELQEAIECSVSEKAAEVGSLLEWVRYTVLPK